MSFYIYCCFPSCYKDGIMMWRSSADLESHDGQPRSAQIEMTSYVLLALFRRGSLVEGIDLMKWLSVQRNHLGGYGTTQVTSHPFPHYCFVLGCIVTCDVCLWILVFTFFIFIYPSMSFDWMSFISLKCDLHGHAEMHDFSSGFKVSNCHIFKTLHVNVLTWISI